MGFVRTVKMSPAQWAAVAPNPRQRNTEDHARRAKHLREPHPAHAFVNAAQLPDGQFVKLDGHTRSHIWQTGDVEAPPVLTVGVWHCNSVEEAKDLYTTFDSRAATESTNDQLFGAKRDNRVEFQSELLGSVKFTNAMRSASDALFGSSKGGISTPYTLLEYWLPELKLLDSVAPSRTKFTTGVTAAALVTLRRYGPEIADFWQAFASNAGTKLGDEMDAVQAFTERLILLRKKASGGGFASRAGTQTIIAIAVSAVEAHLSGRMYSTAGSIKQTKGTSLGAWFIRAKATRRTW